MYCTMQFTTSRLKLLFLIREASFLRSLRSVYADFAFSDRVYFDTAFLLFPPTMLIFRLFVWNVRKYKIRTCQTDSTNRHEMAPTSLSGIRVGGISYETLSWIPTGWPYTLLPIQLHLLLLFETMTSFLSSELF